MLEVTEPIAGVRHDSMRARLWIPRLKPHRAVSCTIAEASLAFCGLTPCVTQTLQHASHKEVLQSFLTHILLHLLRMLCALLAEHSMSAHVHLLAGS